MRKKDNNEIIQEFRLRQTRQIVAVTVSLLLVLFVAVIHKRPDIFGEFSSLQLFALQAVIIVMFFSFTFVNWRCPSCRRHLGGDIYRHKCSRCGCGLQ